MNEVSALRSRRQQISRHDFTSARDLIAWLGAVQAQDPAGARWALGVRLAPGAVTDHDIERDIDEGRILRIHAMRFTWQLVAAEDVRWLIALVAPSVLARASRRLEQLGLDAKTILRSQRALAKGLGGGVHLTRAELARVLEGSRISPEGQRLSHLLGCAELEGVVASGARRGLQPTWALLDDRVPRAKPRPRDDALRELALRYLQSRAPATAADFIWWSGLAPTEARHALESAQVEHGAPSTPVPGTHLLPPFDEYLVGYKDRTAVLDAGHVSRVNAGGGLLAPVIVSNGRVIGTWRRTLGARATVRVEHTSFGKMGAAERPALAEATQRYAEFLGRTLVSS